MLLQVINHFQENLIEQTERSRIIFSHQFTVNAKTLCALKVSLSMDVLLHKIAFDFIYCFNTTKLKAVINKHPNLMINKVSVEFKNLHNV